MSEGDASAAAAMLPLGFFRATPAGGAGIYRRDGATRALLEFFEAKGLARLKEEDRREQWYEDFIEYQKQRGLYAAVLSPARYSSGGGCFDVRRYARFLEAFAYCSPAHGYSLQVTFLGLFSILLGSNEALKREAVAALEAGKLLAFGVSEKSHGSDLMANEFVVTEEAGQWVADGAKYYIGNADAAAIISTLGKKVKSGDRGERATRAPFVLLALRPALAAGFRSLGKIRTLGVRAANVGAFEVRDHAFSESDVIAQGRQAWDAVFGTVTLGKFFLGFGSIGICERAFEEAAAHLRARVLYGKSAMEMPHLRAAMEEAYVRLTAMKMYAYRALEYVHSAHAGDRRYLLFCAVQKAKVSTEGVKVMAILSECMGARGFESDTYFEMALRDAALIPGLEGSMHINLGLAGQFIPRYFDRFDRTLAVPARRHSQAGENAYLMEARTGGIAGIAFRPFLEAYRPLAAIGNVVLFARQAAAFRRWVKRIGRVDASDLQMTMLLGQCLATIAYGQLVAEQVVQMEVREDLTAALFAVLVGDLSAWALQLAALPSLNEAGRKIAVQMMKVVRKNPVGFEFGGR